MWAWNVSNMCDDDNELRDQIGVFLIRLGNKISLQKFFENSSF